MPAGLPGKRCTCLKQHRAIPWPPLAPCSPAPAAAGGRRPAPHRAQLGRAPRHRTAGRHHCDHAGGTCLGAGPPSLSGSHAGCGADGAGAGRMVHPAAGGREGEFAGQLPVPRVAAECAAPAFAPASGGATPLPTALGRPRRSTRRWQRIAAWRWAAPPPTSRSWPGAQLCGWVGVGEATLPLLGACGQHAAAPGRCARRCGWLPAAACLILPPTRRPYSRSN